MPSRWEPENGIHSAAYPRMGMLSRPDLPGGERNHGLATLSLPFGLLLALVDGISRDDEARMRTERMVIQATKRVLQNARANPEDARSMTELLRQALFTANGELYQDSRENPERAHAGASCLLVLVTRGRAYVAHVGNARLYLVRNSSTTRLTRDHTTAQSWIDHGIMTEEQAQQRPEAHSLSRSLGEKSRIEVDVRSLPIHLEKADVLVLCSAGIHRYLADDEMGSMAARLEPEHACQELCQVAAGRSKTPSCKALVYQSGPPRQGNYPRLLQQRRIRRQRRALTVVGAILAVAALAYGGLQLLGGKDGDGEPTAVGPKPLPDIRLVAHNEVPDHAADLLQPDVVTPAPPAEEAVPALAEPTAAPPAEPAPSQVTAPEPAAPAEPEVVAAAAEPEEKAEAPAIDPVRPAFVDVGPSPIKPSDGPAKPVEAPAEPVEEAGPAEQMAEAAPPAETPETLEAAAPGPAVTAPAVVPPVEERKKCVLDDLKGDDRNRVRYIRRMLKEGAEHLDRRKPDASSAARCYGGAHATMRHGSAEVEIRCDDEIEALGTRVKDRYIKLARVSAIRAETTASEQTERCAKAQRMARDARRLGASEEEVNEALGICLKKE